MIAAPSGSQACFRLASLGSMLRAAHQSRTCLSASGCNTSLTPAAAATSSAVRSSWVGPRPPFMIRMRAKPAVRCRAATSRARSSPSVTFSATLWPNAASDWAIIDELLSTVSPLISSSPVSSKWISLWVMGKEGGILETLGGQDSASVSQQAGSDASRVRWGAVGFRTGCR